MRHIIIRTAVIPAVLFAASSFGTAKADFVMNFDALTQNDSLLHDIGPVYSAGGFTLTASHVSVTPSFDFVGTQSVLFPGATALYHHISQGEITLTRTDGGAFNFYSIDLAELPAGDAFGQPINSGPFDITFYGTKVDGASVTDTVTVDSFLTLKTYSLSGLANVVEVHWFQGAGPPASPTHQFDNLDLSAVPAPSGLILGCLASCLLIGYRFLLGRSRQATDGGVGSSFSPYTVGR
jgi:hypothetical protein